MKRRKSLPEWILFDMGHVHNPYQLKTHRISPRQSPDLTRAKQIKLTRVNTIRSCFGNPKFAPQTVSPSLVYLQLEHFFLRLFINY